MRSAPLVSVVVVTFRRRDLLLECLDSVSVARGRLDAPSELLVVDNGSQDDTAAVVRQRFPDARVIVIERNDGFTSAVVRAFSSARGEWIALLNDDVTIEPDALSVMLETGRSAPDIGTVAAQMRFAMRRDVINSAGIVVDRLGVAADRLIGQPIEASEREPVEVFGASGGAAMYRKRMVEQTGGFDETFYGYLEDIDLAWRARCRGWRAFYAPAAVAYHHHSATFVHKSPLKYFLVGRNRVRLLAKNATLGQLVVYGPLVLFYDFGYVAYVLAKEQSLAPLRGRLRGVREWRDYRRLGASGRGAVELAPILGLRAALRRATLTMSPVEPASRGREGHQA
jgi:GT2 family glycosyltransferase